VETETEKQKHKKQKQETKWKQSRNIEKETRYEEYREGSVRGKP
jgi:hypothetical protein